MDKRKTVLAVDQNGKQYILMRGEASPIHTTGDVVALFMEENKTYKECEVIEIIV